MVDKNDRKNNIGSLQIKEKPKLYLGNKRKYNEYKDLIERDIREGVVMRHVEMVYDWNDRIKDYPENIKQLYYQVWEIEKYFNEILEDKTLNWRNCAD